MQWVLYEIDVNTALIYKFILMQKRFQPYGPLQLHDKSRLASKMVAVAPPSPHSRAVIVNPAVIGPIIPDVACLHHHGQSRHLLQALSI